MDWRAFKSLVAPLQRRIMLMVGRGALSSVDDSQARQLLQFTALAGETKDKVERVQNFGFTSNPAAGAQVVFVCVGGNRDLPLALAVDNAALRPLLQPGEAAIYHDPEHYIIMKADGSIEVKTTTLRVIASEKVRMETPRLECTGDIVDLSGGAGQSMKDMRDIYNTHHHDENNVLHGPTDIPDELMDE